MGAVPVQHGMPVTTGTPRAVPCLGDDGPVTSTYRVMTVCTGNICRSPMAEVVLRARFEAAGLDVVVDSTGVSDEEHGRPMDPRASGVLANHGYPLPAHRARQVRAGDVSARDLVLAMTARHARALRALGPGDVRMYRSFDPAAAVGGPEHLLDVEDPWYGDRAGFVTTLQQVEAGADGIVEHVRAALR